MVLMMDVTKIRWADKCAVIITMENRGNVCDSGLDAGSYESAKLYFLLRCFFLPPILMSFTPVHVALASFLIIQRIKPLYST